jgi:arylsulfatase A-like enzyme
MITVLDLFPTLMQAANIDLQPTPSFDGRPMWGRLTSEADASDPIALLIAEDRGALWSGGFKLLLRPASEPELYNILSDPQETLDLSGEYMLQRDELSSLFNARVEEYKESRP